MGVYTLYLEILYLSNCFVNKTYVGKEEIEHKTGKDERKQIMVHGY